MKLPMTLDVKAGGGGAGVPQRDVPPPLGRLAFEAYNNAKGGVTYDGKPIPPWDAVGDDVRAAWEAAAQAVNDVSLAASIAAVESTVDEVCDRIERQYQDAFSRAIAVCPDPTVARELLKIQNAIAGAKR